MSVSVPVLQLRSPDPWYPALQEGWQVDPWGREDGQLLAAPLVGAALAFGHGYRTQAVEVVDPNGLVFPAGQSLHSV